MKKLLAILALSAVCVFSAVGFVACDDNNASVPETGMQKVYNLYVAYAEENGLTTISYEEWLATIKGAQGIQGKKGEKGEKGEDGKDGVTPTFGVSEDGYWVINDVKTEYKAIGVDGKDGAKGDTGVGVKSVEIDENGDLILTMTDDRVIHAGKVKDVHPHEIKEKEIVEQEATCTATGVKYIICETCGELIKTIITDKAPHTYEDEVTKPTCTEQGYTTHTCKLCGHVEKDTYTAIIPHTYDNIVTPATCTEQGYTTHTCKVCGHVEIDSYTTADTTEHNYVEIGDVYGECALSMQQNYKCTRCKHEKTEKVTVQAPAVHNTLKVGDTCEHCGWTVYAKNGDSVLMKNDKDQLSAEFYGTETYTFGGELRQLYVNVYMADSVTSIESYAFDGCSSLTSITIPNSVTSIGYRAFAYCSKLTNITIPDSVTSIGSYAFDGCPLKTEIENGLIYHNNMLLGIKSVSGLPQTSYTVREGTTVIAGQAFYNKTFITDIYLPNSLKGIGDEAFYGCSSLTNITIPDSVTWIGYVAFQNCVSLTNITIPDSVTSIVEWEFCHCSSLTDVTIPNSVTRISGAAFLDCSSLTSINYSGTMEQWNKISKDYNWRDNSAIKQIICTDGTIKV